MATQRRNFTEAEINAVWDKAIIVPNNNPNVFRQDYAGAWIRRDSYGNTSSEYGWEIDHLRPLSQDGSYDLDNLYPLQWKNNCKKGDGYPSWQTAVTADGVHNGEQIRSWFVKI